MNSSNFLIHNELPDDNSKEFVVVQAGKGKEDQSVIYVHTSGFSYLEGLIWNKYREYGNVKKSKIPSPEWKRILQGFQSAVDELNTSNSDSDFENILKFDIINPKYPVSEVVDVTFDVAHLIEEISSWISSYIGTEKYILIIKSKTLLN